MGSTISETWLNTLIMGSLPLSYQPTLQTITAAEQAAALTSTTLNQMKPKDLVEFLIEEAQHHVINDKHAKNSDHALAANARKSTKGKSKATKADDKPQENGDNVVCSNCNRPCHTSGNCYRKGGGKEGQWPG